MPQRPAEKPKQPAAAVAAGASKPKPKPSAIPQPPPAGAAAVNELKVAPLGRSSDEELMKRTQEEDSQAFEILYERYSQSVLSYLYRMLGNLEDVESIGQEVFLRAFR